jgi:hypothetical protein
VVEKQEAGELADSMTATAAKTSAGFPTTEAAMASADAGSEGGLAFDLKPSLS